MEIILALAGLGIVMWAPSCKVKSICFLGGANKDGSPDLTKLEPTSTE